MLGTEGFPWWFFVGTNMSGRGVFYRQMVMMALIWGREHCGKNFLKAHFSPALVEDGGIRASPGTWYICELTVFISYGGLTSVLPLPGV